jgi:uncharacterized OsmC-like protein
MPMPESSAREYAVNAASTETFGRVLTSARNQHLVVDGPVQNGCPGEAITPAELFLAGVATCGVELVQVIAKNDGLPLKSVKVNIRGVMDKSKPVRPDVTLFNTVDIRFLMKGISEQQARTLVESFKGR